MEKDMFLIRRVNINLMMVTLLPRRWTSNTAGRVQDYEACLANYLA